MEKAKAIAIGLFLCLLILQVVDIITTEILLYQNDGDFIELNILMRKIMDEGGMRDMIYAKMVITCLLGGLFLFIWKKDHYFKKHIPLALAIGVVMSTVTVVNNLWWCMTW
jgi:hypothetical protein